MFTSGNPDAKGYQEAPPSELLKTEEAVPRYIVFDRSGSITRLRGGSTTLGPKLLACKLIAPSLLTTNGAANTPLLCSAYN